ncbi:ATP-binding cassette domain-containing protein, partial [Rhodoplanes roseus]
VALADGTRLVNHVDLAVAPAERVLLVGDSGTGKSALVRSLGGCWPWGEGEIAHPGAVAVVPQRPYVPAGSLREAVAYPRPRGAVDDAAVRDALAAVGLAPFLPRLDEDLPWERMLSAGEKQRLAFARLLLHRPAVIVLDEATSALDVAAQAQVMTVVADRLPEAAVLSVGHRPELAAFHDRRVTLTRRPDGARIVADEPLRSTRAPAARAATAPPERVEPQTT